MPFLEEETTIYPENLFGEFCAASTDRLWWAVYTKARQEKSLARQLLKKQTPFYLPLQAKEHLIRGKQQHSFLPMFTGYLFLYANEEERVRCLATNRVSQLIPVSDQDQLGEDLENLHRVQLLNEPLELEERPRPGQRVRVMDGAMMGVEGTVTALKGKSRLVVSVRFLDQGVSLEVEDSLLEGIE